MKGSKMNLAFGLETIYEDAEFLLNERDKVGIVGVNGAGKTTLFRILLRELELDSGSISVGNARIGYLPQEIVLEDEKQTVSIHRIAMIIWAIKIIRTAGAISYKQNCLRCKSLQRVGIISIGL